jgi:hypothetical protein
MIIRCLWAVFLFSLWIILSLNNGTEGEWWSMFSLNPEKYGPMALDFSIFKIFIFAFLSVITGYILTKWTGGEKT